VEEAIMSLMPVQAIKDELQSTSEMFEGAADLRLLRMIDDTCDSLAAMTKLFRGVADCALKGVARIASTEVKTGIYLDPNDDVIDSLNSSAARLRQGIPGFEEKKASIDLDPQLAAHHRDMLHSSYDDALKSIARLVESAEQMVAAIIRHDLAAEPRDGRIYTDAKELIDSLQTMAH
jgi:hypothetical protein